MARPLRIEYPGALYHAMNRGNAGQDLFRTKIDRERFLGCLDTAVELFSLEIHAYCLMITLYHLLMETMVTNPVKFKGLGDLYDFIKKEGTFQTGSLPSSVYIDEDSVLWSLKITSPSERNRDGPQP